MIAKIKKNDTVKVIAGNDAGKTGKVIGINREKGTATVDGINIQKKHRKARSAQETSRIEDMLGPVDLSNLMVVCPTCGKAVRVGITVVKDENGKDKKVRVCKNKKCHAVIDKTAEAKAAKKAVKKTAKAAEETAEPAKKAPRKTAAKKAEGAATEVKKAPRKTAAKKADAE